MGLLPLTSTTSALRNMILRKIPFCSDSPKRLTFSERDKNRIPAWCDRVLWRGTNLRQLQYHTADLRVSDHRPVWSTFDCTIDVVDNGLKDNLRRALYMEKQQDALSASVNLLDLEDEENQPPISIAPGLPPASSARSRWWLDHGTCLVTGRFSNQKGANFIR